MTGVPGAMREAKRWVTWCHLDGRKPPCDAEGKPCDGSDDAAWLTYEDAWTRWRDCDPVDGIGFVVGAGFTMLDLDDCRQEDGTLDHRALAVLDLVPTAYAEVSPSGKGVKVFGSGGPGWLELNFRDPTHVRVERKGAGYGCVTGEALEGRTAMVELPLEAVAQTFGAHVSEEAGRKVAPPLAHTVPPGSQEPAMFREAARLRRLGWEVPEITAALWGLVKAGRFPNEPGREAWTEEDCRRKAESVARYDKTGDTHPITDPGGAEFFHATAASEARYDVDRERWLLFDDVRWNPDVLAHVRLRVVDSVRARQRQAVGDTDRLKALVRVENRVPQILTAAEPLFATRVCEYDTDPWLLGVPNGVVDLRTGELRGGRPEDGITMQAAFPYNPKAEAPLWEQTVAQVFALNGAPRAEFVAYVQRALGYSCTGDCREEVFFLATGLLEDDAKSGANGKGTLLNTVTYVLGDYASNLGFASLEWQRNGSGAGAASPDLAKLIHKRFVTASETNKGAQFNSARIKALTGRDPITARFLYGEEFTFRPELKMWLSVNHPPRVNDDSIGFWRRPHVVVFPNTFAASPDQTLKDRLLAEGPGILTWLVRGALAWQQGGLNPPPEVRDAVLAYQQQQGDLPDFLDDRCTLAPEARATFGELRDAYLKWCASEHRRAVGAREFGRRLRGRFGEPKRANSAASALQYPGVGLRSDVEGRELGTDDDLPF